MPTDLPAGAPPPAAPAAGSGAPSAASRRNVPIPQLVGELRELAVAYVKQETLVPLQSLGRWVAFGIAGSLLMGLGVVFLGLSGLRALQEETGETFTGNWSWVPYLIVVAALVIGAVIVWLLRTARTAERAAR
jgi:hypothetical protein